MHVQNGLVIFVLSSKVQYIMEETRHVANKHVRIINGNMLMKTKQHSQAKLKIKMPTSEPAFEAHELSPMPPQLVCNGAATCYHIRHFAGRLDVASMS